MIMFVIAKKSEINVKQNGGRLTLANWLPTTKCAKVYSRQYSCYMAYLVYIYLPYTTHTYTHINYTVKAQNKNNELQTITGFPIGNVQ